MKRILLLASCAMIVATVFAQEDYTEGYVREVNFFRTKQDHFDDYMKYLRANFLPQQEEAKKEGLIVDFKVMLKTPANPSDWDVAIVTIYKSFGAALDYNQEDDNKMKAIAGKFFKTADEQKQREMTAKRFEYRDYLGTNYLREINLRPMQ